MARPKIKLPQNISYKIEKLLPSIKDLSEYKRLQCVYFRAKYDYDAKNIAVLTGYTEQTVRDIHSLFINGGFKALKIKDRGGRYNSLLSIKEEEELIDKFEKEGKKGGIIEVSKIHKAIEEKTNKKVAKSTTYRILDRHNWRQIMPRPYHPKSNKTKEEEFKKTSNT
jgi:transposase